MSILNPRIHTIFKNQKLVHFYFYVATETLDCSVDTKINKIICYNFRSESIVVPCVISLNSTGRDTKSAHAF